MSAVHVYAHVVRSSLVEEGRYSFVDEHLIRSLHIESIYDVIQFVRVLSIDELAKLIDDSQIKKLKRYREVIVSGEDADRVLEYIRPSNATKAKYIVLRLCDDQLKSQ
jgi:hypothetical protein